MAWILGAELMSSATSDGDDLRDRFTKQWRVLMPAIVTAESVDRHLDFWWPHPRDRPTSWSTPPPESTSLTKFTSLLLGCHQPSDENSARTSDWSASDLAFRDEVRTFLQENLTPDIQKPGG